MICSFTRLSHWLVLGSISLTTALPTGPKHADESFDPNHVDETVGSFYLRILALGGSITVGWGSSTGNG